MNFLAFWITAMVIIGLTQAVDDDETSIENQISPESDAVTDLTDSEFEGRACHDCHGGSSGEYIDPGNFQQIQYGNIKTGWDWLIEGLGFKSIWIIIIPIIGLEIAIVILLAIILKHIKIITKAIPYEEEPTYAYTYHTYDAGPAPYASAPSYGGYGGGAASYGGGGTSYGGGAAKPATGGYVKRTTRGAPNFASRSTLDYATNIFEKAFEKYLHIDEPKE